jgi:SulP family sulfate permease
MLIAAGVLRVGTLMKYMPQPVITGFTAGIAVSIFLSQIKDLFGLHMGSVPAEFFERLTAYVQHFNAFNAQAVVLALSSLALIIVLRRWRPTWPGFLIAVIVASFASALTGTVRRNDRLALRQHLGAAAPLFDALYSVRAYP